MLTITRKVDQSIIISPNKSLDPRMTVSELFGQSKIEVHFNKIRHGVASVSIQAPRELDLIRDELLE